MTTAHLVMVVANVAIALAYAGNAVFIAPRFTFDTGAPVGARVARTAGTLFFILCAVTHMRIAHLALDGEHAMDTAFDIAVHIAQGAAGWAFLMTASVFLDIRLKPKEAAR